MQVTETSHHCANCTNFPKTEKNTGFCVFRNIEKKRDQSYKNGFKKR